MESPSCSARGKRRPFSFAPSECSDISELDISSIAPADLPGRCTTEADAGGGPSEPMRLPIVSRQDKLVSKVDASRPICREENMANVPELYCIGSPADSVRAAAIRRRLYFDSPSPGSTFADKAADYTRRCSLEHTWPRMSIRSDKDWVVSPDRREMLTPESESRRLPISPGAQLSARALAPVLEDVARRARDGEASPSGWSQAEATLEGSSVNIGPASSVVTSSVVISEACSPSVKIELSAVISEAGDSSFSALSCEPTYETSDETSAVCQSVQHGASQLDGSKVEAYSDQSPVIKKMSIKKARAMMKELRNKLTSRQARKSFQNREKVDGKEDTEGKFTKRAPMVEMIVGDIIKKYGFETGPGGGGRWGIQQAVQAAEQAGGQNYTDKKIAAAIEDFTDVCLGTARGKLPELDALAEEFLGMDERNRTEALKKAERKSGGELYAQTMKNVMKKGDDYIVKLYKEFDQAWENEERDPGLKAELRERLNVIREFLRDEVTTGTSARCCAVPRLLRILLRVALCNVPTLLFLNRQELLDWSRGSSHLGVPRFVDSEIDHRSGKFKVWWPRIQSDGANNMNMYSESHDHTPSVNATEVLDPLEHSTAIISAVAVFVMGRV